MIIDLKSIPYYWINLDEHTENAKAMESQFAAYGIKDHTRIAGIRDSVHYIGVGKSHIKAMKTALERDIFPCVILEDDAKLSGWEKQYVKIDDNVDGLYLGISTAGTVKYERQNSDFSKIQGMLAAHAICYIKKPYITEMKNICAWCIYTQNVPWDLGSAKLQEKYNVWCCNDPYYYQANERQSANKWESLTNKSV